MVSPLEIFCCYARKDQSLLKELVIHLTPLQRRGLIVIKSDININAGAVWEEEIKKHLNTAQIILLLISPDFIASEYCYSTEMQQALERHDSGEARVIPIILRPTNWKGAPFDKLQVLPTNAKPVTDRRSWLTEDEALNDVAEGIRIVVEGISKSSLAKTSLQVKVERSNPPIPYKQNEPSEPMYRAATEEQFHEAMVNLYHETYKAIHYRATYFYRMVNELGGVETAHRLIAKESTEGFTKLWEEGRLDLSVEALVLKPEFAALFNEIERKKARERLAEYGYEAPRDS
jgi:TIR domain